MKNMPCCLLFALAAICALGSAYANEPLRFQSGAQQTPLIELYTSEGCSSCPPADRWYKQLGDDDGLWDKFVPLAFHVTYWNYLGWRDAFSDEAFDQRQRRSAARASSGVYTPGVFVDGAEYRKWRGQRAAPAGDRRGDVGKLSVRIEDGRVAVAFAPAAAHKNLRVEVALLASGLTSKVRAGENKGRLLQHDFVVTDLSQTALKRDGDLWAATVTLPPTDDVGRPPWPYGWWTIAVRRCKLPAAG